jgi:phage replication-related protein YjqB (UPF0714/DUF867 family)
MAEPRSYEEILARKYVPGRDLRIEFGDNNLDRCLLIAPHGGGIEPGTSEIMRAVADLGGWAWYEFAGFLRQGNKEALHLGSADFDEPTLMSLLPRTAFVLAFHGASESQEPVVYVGGKWELGREAAVKAINVGSSQHGIRASDATANDVAAHLGGLEDANITNRGRLAKGVQLEFSRGARNRLFPPDCSREARGRRSTLLRSLARSIHTALETLCAQRS